MRYISTGVTQDMQSYDNEARLEIHVLCFEFYHDEVVESNVPSLSASSKARLLPIAMASFFISVGTGLSSDGGGRGEGVEMVVQLFNNVDHASYRLELLEFSVSFRILSSPCPPRPCGIGTPFFPWPVCAAARYRAMSAKQVGRSEK